MRRSKIMLRPIDDGMIRLISQRRGRKLLFVAILVLVAISPLVQAVGAQLFFDPQMFLRMKSSPELRTLSTESSSQDKSQVSVLLTFTETPSLDQMRRLAELGTLESFTGHVASIHVPFDSLSQVASLEFVSHIYAPRRLTAQLDKSVPEILANQVWTTLRDAAGNAVNGTGVVVGIVDTGMDYTHRDFFFPNGTSKILYIWDESVDGKIPDGFSYGNECSRPDIQAGTCSEIDGQTNGEEPGHGTAVAAVAASSGQSASFLTSCLRYDGTTWHDDAELCNDASGKSFVLLAGSSDYRYFGNSDKFDQLFLDIQSSGQYGNFTWEYSEGAGKWSPINIESNQTSNLARSGTIFFTPPTDWAKDIVNHGQSEYWIRVRAQGVLSEATITHVQASPPYIGVAPGALIIAVKIRDGTDESILDGVNYIVRKARELGLPFVINDSFADILGSHDGTEPLEVAYSDLASEGVPIVVVAGNERNANIHVSGKLNTGQSVTVPWSNGQAPNHYIDIWYSVADVLEISVTTPQGVVVAGPTPDSGVYTENGNVVILSDQRPTGKEWFVNITSSGTPREERWSFNLIPESLTNGKWDAWTTPGRFLSAAEFPCSPFACTGAQEGIFKIDPSDTIDYPGNAAGVITVGDYMTKYYWRSGCTSCIDYTTSLGKRGVWWTLVSNEVGNITDYSGMGPTRDGRTKPEIVAPGANIATARAVNSPARNSDPDNYHQMYRGTSVSAPHVAGVVALMLQRNHYLSPDEIKVILTQDARQDEFTGKIDKRIGSPLWGWGKVNALNSTRDALTLYSFRLEIDSLGKALSTNLTLDGQSIGPILLDNTRTINLEFQRGGHHTVTISNVIPVQEGTRYAPIEDTWVFSSGGTGRVHYNLQYYLQVTSPYGYATGTGWYDANSTATASIAPTSTEGHVFEGWIGSALAWDTISRSQTITLKMDASKQLDAVWLPAATFVTYAVGLAAVILIALFLHYRRKRRHSRTSLT